MDLPGRLAMAAALVLFWSLAPCAVAYLTLMQRDGAVPELKGYLGNGIPGDPIRASVR